MSNPILRVQDLNKSFEGVHAVRGVSFEMEAGQVVGFIGANGAGKTTTMRMLVALETPDSGSIEVAGLDAVQHPHEVRRLVGWMPDAYGAYEHTSVLEYLDFYARLAGLRGAERVERLSEVMDFSGLLELADRPMNGLSKGMAQRLCLGRALLQKPPILIMDEPAAGLDPKARLEFKNAVAILKKQGVTIFISSHILSELEEMCDTLLFLDQGKVVHHGARGSLQGMGVELGGVDVEIRVAGSEESLLTWLKMQAHWTFKEQLASGAIARFSGNGPEALSGELVRMVEDKIPVCSFHPHQRRLEEIFVDVLKSGVQVPPLPKESK